MMRWPLLLATTRSIFIGLLGLLAATFGALFLDLQRAAWLVLGTSHVGLGLLPAGGRARSLMKRRAPDAGSQEGLTRQEREATCARSECL